ncbi:MAG: penicillin-binding protein 1C [Flavobacteriales bacterium]|nr:penicillin-binding protein 1C [Flavobacteriales bacterium]
MTRRRRKRLIWLGAGTVLFILFWNCLPDPLFNEPVSTVIEDHEGHLLGAGIATDGQWRFPSGDRVPEKFRKALLTFEDKRFYYHPGVDPIALARAIWQNISEGRTVSGGSTITMQVVRLARKGKARTLKEKMIEVVMALRLELTNSKEEILALYAAHAPFGGNVVGLEAASWRYFSRSPDQLSWAEASVLAVLPNAPSLLFPGKNERLLKDKRDRLLDHLLENDDLTEEETQLAKLETTPTGPTPLPQNTMHLLQRITQEHGPGRYRTTLRQTMQRQAVEVIERHLTELSANGIFNAAALILDTRTGNVLAYVGNGRGKDHRKHGRQVDVITAPRSTGSILKPFLYAAMLTSGDILPEALVADIPINIGGYAPTNFDRGFNGAVPASRALAKSLNIPAVVMLQDYGIERFHHILKKSGLTTLNQPAMHYGLSMILGGAEATLWDLCGTYASMARSLNHFNERNGRYFPSDYHAPRYLADNTNNSDPYTSSHLGAGAIWTTFNTMLDVERPEEEGDWHEFSSSRMVAWKTGTSLGFRDGWAIGVTPDFVIGVWTGNADGEGRAGLIGLRAAAPVLFDLVRILPEGKQWFDRPYDDLIKVAVCRQSGYRAGLLCEDQDSAFVPALGERYPACPYHKIAHLSKDEKWQVHATCASLSDMVSRPWFVLPPAMEWYYTKHNAMYRPLPSYRSDCLEDMAYDNHNRSMELVYPRHSAHIFVPTELGGTLGATVFEAAHRDVDATIFWYLDDTFLGNTKGEHRMAFTPTEGAHTITLVDTKGEEFRKTFEVIGR